MTEQLIGIGGVAHRLGVSTTTVRKLVQQEKLTEYADPAGTTKAMFSARQVDALKKSGGHRERGKG